jgi:FkbM family methyltransferase
MNNSLDERIQSMLSGPGFALVGAGQLGEMAVDLWPEGIPKPRFFLDSTRTGTCRGIKIENLQEHRPNASLTYLLSAFKLPAANVEEIFRRLGQPVVLTVYDLFAHYCPEKFSNGWRCLDLGDEKLARIRAARECFADSRSLEVFEATVAWRYRRELVPGFTCEPEESKYDVARLGKAGECYDLVLDCGSYDMSFAKNLVSAGNRVLRYIAFEPDDRSFSRCLDAVRTLDAVAPNSVALERFAVFDRAAPMRFLNLGVLSSRLTVSPTIRAEVPTKEVVTITLDQYLSSHSTLSDSRQIILKLHIEGAEFAALRGAEQLIQQYRPDMFINLSHDEESFLDIPIYLKRKWSYKLKLVGHSLFGEGLTLVVGVG